METFRRLRDYDDHALHPCTDWDTGLVHLVGHRTLLALAWHTIYSRQLSPRQDAPFSCTGCAHCSTRSPPRGRISTVFSPHPVEGVPTRMTMTRTCSPEEPTFFPEPLASYDTREQFLADRTHFQRPFPEQIFLQPYLWSIIFTEQI